MGSIYDIVDGHLKELTGKNQKTSEERLEICLKCPIIKLHPVFGPMCDSSKWINKNNEMSEIKRRGFTQGCGCRLSAKTRLQHAHCIIEKW